MANKLRLSMIALAGSLSCCVGACSPSRRSRASIRPPSTKWTRSGTGRHPCATAWT